MDPRMFDSTIPIKKRRDQMLFAFSLFIKPEIFKVASIKTMSNALTN